MLSKPLWGVIVAAGRGERTGALRPKQYHPLAGRLVLDWAVDAMLQTPQLQGLMLVLAEDDETWQNSPLVNEARIHTTIGGMERSDSVIAGLRALQRSGAGDEDRVLIHDAARPAVDVADIQRLIEAVGDDPQGGLLAVPVRDTLKRAGEDARAASTVDRKALWQAMTPQLFPLGALLDALTASSDIAPTDESQAMERAGWQPRLVEGSPQNIKYTYPEDLAWLESIILNRKEARE